MRTQQGAAYLLAIEEIESVEADREQRIGWSCSENVSPTASSAGAMPYLRAERS